jgi:hypothetical protein
MRGFFAALRMTIRKVSVRKVVIKQVLRKDPPVKEKAAWILLMALVMVSEIRNLYVADAEQAGKFDAS